LSWERYKFTWRPVLAWPRTQLLVDTGGRVRTCPDTEPRYLFQRWSITHWLRSDVPSKVVSDRADVSEGVIDKHYDERTAQEKMLQRRGYLVNV